MKTSNKHKQIEERKIEYNPQKLAELYNYHPQFGALAANLELTQYGFLNGEIKNPTRYFLLYERQLQLISDFVSKNSVVLDLGCGMGHVAEKIQPKVKGYMGIDIAKERIKQCKQRLKSEKFFFFTADASKLPFSEAYFDVVIASEIIEHIPDTNLFLQSIRRVLKKGGILIISTPCSFFFEHNLQLLYQHEHLYVFTPRKLTRILKENGFSVEDMKGFGFKSPKIKIPLWLGSPIIKYFYSKIKRKELRSGYRSPISLQFDLVGNPLFDWLYFRLKNKGLWFFMINSLSFLGKNFPILASKMVIKCKKE